MTAETENLVLELLRGMRSDMDGLRRDIAAVKQDVQQLRTEMGERFEAVETQLEGLRYVVVASVGSLVTDMKDHETRIAALEGVRV